ncbi:MFS transporter [Dickeya solani]|uniref:MFS transporter n=1 Tax=Dickeya solani TaxID=1089444 RepID=A0ABU4EAE3_9GAMM|nr:MFS transporter [Dickeya solani]MCA6997623.1 MFS transporter [Dickeya solani]MCZ0821273.1 MFS transporter [Dickeya solani]MDV6997534.1 MFS transporter [Dickeya solani]MDV7003639.1 MFS transporter [Dickeya solani]MDV7036132.1 MFS transporter [Dickeya solani]
MSRFRACFSVRPNGVRPTPMAIFLIGIVQILVWGGSFFLLSVLGRSIMEDTGWSRQWVYGGLSLGIFISGLLIPRCGDYVARHGGRGMLAWSGIVTAAGLLLMACSTGLPAFIAAWVILGGAMAIGLYDALYATLGDSYGVQAKSAITTITLISGFCTTIVWPLLAFGVAQWGWRHTCIAWAVVLLATVWPVYRCTLPAPRQARENTTTRKNGVMTFDRRTYVLLSTIFMLSAVIMTVISVQLIDLLQDEGLSLAAAIGISAVIGPSQVAARVMDLVIRLSHPVWSLLISVSLVLAGVVFIGLFPAHALLAVVVYGAGNGLRSIVRGTLPLAILQPDEFAVVMGKMARPSLIGQAVTPLIGGYLFDVAGSRSVLLAVVLVAGINLLLTLLLIARLKEQGKLPAQ